jgi:hypothetical protein
MNVTRLTGGSARECRSGLLGLVANLATNAALNEHATLGAALGLAGFDELGTGTVDHDNNLT